MNTAETITFFNNGGYGILMKELINIDSSYDKEWGGLLFVKRKNKNNDHELILFESFDETLLSALFIRQDYKIANKWTCIRQKDVGNSYIDIHVISLNNIELARKEVPLIKKNDKYITCRENMLMKIKN